MVEVVVLDFIAFVIPCVSSSITLPMGFALALYVKAVLRTT